MMKNKPFITIYNFVYRVLDAGFESDMFNFKLTFLSPAEHDECLYID